VSAAPQSPQNLLPDGLSASHAAQRTNSGAPQSPQTLLPFGLTLPQLGQSMSHPIQLLIYLSSHRFPSKSRPSERDIAPWFRQFQANASGKLPGCCICHFERSCDSRDHEQFVHGKLPRKKGIFAPRLSATILVQSDRIKCVPAHIARFVRSSQP
jgi:hypothetical protein